MKHPTPISYDNYYHIYNRGINGCDLFRDTTDYELFLRLYSRHIDPVADTFAWVLMKNHFHLLVRIFTDDEIDFIKPREENINVVYPVRKKYNPTQQFGNLFNAYTKTINLKYNRTGSLFESPFRRIPVPDKEYFKQLVFYIHNNPVHHGFCESMIEYRWSSYLTTISFKPTKLKRDKVIGWFNSKSEFVEFHHQKHDNKTIESTITD